MGQRTDLQELAVQQRRDERAVGVRVGYQVQTGKETRDKEGDRQNPRAQPRTPALETE